MTPIERLAHLKALDVLTKQEAFDLTVLALRLQGCKAKGPNPKYNPSDPHCIESKEICVYRSADGKACAAGHHIRDDEYNPAMETRNISYVFRNDMSTSLNLRLKDHSKFLRDLQHVHDHSDPNYWEVAWQSLARDERLIYTPPETSA